EPGPQLTTTRADGAVGGHREAGGGVEDEPRVVAPLTGVEALAVLDGRDLDRRDATPVRPAPGREGGEGELRGDRRAAVLGEPGRHLRGRPPHTLHVHLDAGGPEVRRREVLGT